MAEDSQWENQEELGCDREELRKEQESIFSTPNVVE